MFRVVLVAMSIGSASALQPNIALSGRHMRQYGRSSPLQLSEQRWTDPILDESLPDPVFDGKSPYKGRVPYGFSNFAETLNGRVAMMAFVVLFLQEAIVGQGVLSQYGLPYDEGAVLLNQGDGFTLPGAIGLLIATVITGGMTYAGEFIDDKLRASPAKGITKLPFGMARKD